MTTLSWLNYAANYQIVKVIKKNNMLEEGLLYIAVGQKHKSASDVLTYTDDHSQHKAKHQVHTTLYAVESLTDSIYIMIMDRLWWGHITVHAYLTQSIYFSNHLFNGGCLWMITIIYQNPLACREMMEFRVNITLCKKLMYLIEWCINRHFFFVFF